MFKESVRAFQAGLSIDPNNAQYIKEKADTELCVRKLERTKELLAQVRRDVYEGNGDAGEHVMQVSKVPQRLQCRKT